MRQYNLMLVFRPDFDIEDAKKRDELIKKLLNGTTAEIVETEVLGKRELAYEINKYREAHYVLLRLQTESFQLAPFEQQIKLGDTVIRYLLTVRKPAKAETGKKK